MPLKDRRSDYSWGPTRVDRVLIQTDRKSYSAADPVKASVSFRVVGGLREAFHPDVWTVAWEDFDKRVRLTMRVDLGEQRAVGVRKLAQIKKQVRIASFYWSRDPDLPYRIWPMIMHEDGGAPIIPHSVEDARSKMLDVEKSFTLPAGGLGRGKHRLVAGVRVAWGRRSFIEKGSVSLKSKPAAVEFA